MSFACTPGRELRSSNTPHATPNSKPIVYVVDDDVSVRESLEQLIRIAGLQPKTFASAQEFLDHPRSLVPSCLVLDMHLPDLDGLELQKRLTAERTVLPIIFITGCGDVPRSVQAMKAGAVEFLIKPVSTEALLSSIQQAIVRGRIALDRAVEMHDLWARYRLLSPRERQVMALVVSGLLNKQISSELGITLITVKTHRGRVMHKMRADSVAELVRMFAKLRRASTTETESLPGAA